MGWTCYYHASHWKYDRKGNRSVDRRKECDDLLNHERKEAVTTSDGRVYPAMKDTVLKSAMVGRVYYAAVKREIVGKQPYVWAAVFLTCGKRTDGIVWGYKDMDETMLPYYFDCPAGILALLTPTDNENANNWREECRKKIAERAEARKNGPKPLFVPKGVEVRAERGSWILSSEHYRRYSGYAGIRYTKKAWHNDFERVMFRFLEKYGTDEQRKGYAESGRERPESWKGSAA